MKQQSRFLAALAIAVLSCVTALVASDTEKILLNVPGGTFGTYPQYLLRASDGTIFGTMAEGGNPTCQTTCGIVFKLAPNSSGQLQESIIHVFTGGTDGAQPTSIFTDANGNLFVSTLHGGATKCFQGCGAIIELSPIQSGGYKTTVVWDSPGGAGGQNPEVEIIDAQGNLYGNEGSGSTSEIFELSPSSSGTWSHKALYRFKNGTDGSSGIPQFMDANGNIFGTALFGGNTTNCQDGCGTIWELSPNSNGTWTFNVIYTFLGVPDGWFPEYLVPDGAGNIFGTTYNGGNGTSAECVAAQGCGTLFELSPSSTGGYTETILHDFNDTLDGHGAGVIARDSSGNLFVSVTSGGVSTAGLVLEFSPQVNGPWLYTILHGFAALNGGGYPERILLDSADNVYGFTYNGGSKNHGVIFELSPPAANLE